MDDAADALHLEHSDCTGENRSRTRASIDDHRLPSVRFWNKESERDKQEMPWEKLFDA